MRREVPARFGRESGFPAYLMKIFSKRRNTNNIRINKSLYSIAYMKTRAYTGKMFENEGNSKKLQKDAKKVLTEA